MIRVTRHTDYGMVLLTHIAASAADRQHTARALADETHLPLPMVSKILKLLAHTDLLTSHRGAKGGYRLARTPNRIAVAEIITALEGPIAITQCSGDEPCCEHETFCNVSGNWQRINQAIRVALENLTLADMATPDRAGASGLLTLRGYGEAPSKAVTATALSETMETP